MWIVPEITENENMPSQRAHRESPACTQDHVCTFQGTQTLMASCTAVSSIMPVAEPQNRFLSDTEGKQLFSNCQSYFH